MRVVVLMALATCGLLTGSYAPADDYRIRFDISASIDNVFVYADEWNGQVYAWDLFPIALGSAPVTAELVLYAGAAIVGALLVAVLVAAWLNFYGVSRRKQAASVERSRKRSRRQ